MIGRPLSVCMLFSLKESTSSLLFLRHWSALIIGVAFLHQPGVVAALFLFRHWQEATAYKYDIYLLPTTGRNFDFALFTSRATCAGEPKLAPQAVCVWIREEHVRSVENRGAQHVVQLCTQAVGLYAEFDSSWYTYEHEFAPVTWMCVLSHYCCLG